MGEVKSMKLHSETNTRGLTLLFRTAMLNLIIKVATALPETVQFIEMPISTDEAKIICAAAHEDSRAIPNEAIVTGDVKLGFEDDNGPVEQFPSIAFPAAVAPDAVERLLGIAAEQTSYLIACGRAVAAMMQEGKTEAEIDLVLTRLETELNQRYA